MEPEPEPSGPGGDDSDPGTPRRAWIRIALVFYGGLLALACLIAWVLGSGSPFHAAAEAAAGGSTLGRDVTAGLLAGAILLLASHALERTQWGEALSRTLAELLGPLTLRECAVMAVASGVAEEAFFRGALQPHIGLAAASFLFALAHFVPRRDLLPWTGFALVAGLLFGWLFDATGNLLAPVIAHAAVNAVNLRVLTRKYADRV